MFHDTIIVKLAHKKMSEGEVTKRNVETEKKEEEKEEEDNTKENIEKLREMTSLIKNEGKPVKKNKPVNKKNMQCILFLYVLVFIFSGLSIIIRVYNATKRDSI